VWQIWQLLLSEESVEEAWEKRIVKMVNTKIRFIITESFSMSRIDFEFYHGKNVRARTIFTFLKGISAYRQG